MTDDKDFRGNDFPSYFKIQDRLQYIEDFLQPNDLVVFSFSGHGVTIGGESHLVVSDSRIQNMKETTINLEKDVIAMLNRAGVKKSLLLIDACRENFQENKGINSDGLKAKIFEKAEVAATFYATKSGWYSYEDNESSYGVFTRFVVEGLKGNADKNQGNNDGIVSFKELSTYVENGVFNWALENDKKQKPYTRIYGESYGDLALSIAMRNIDGSSTNNTIKKENKNSFESELLVLKAEKLLNSEKYLEAINLLKKLENKNEKVPIKLYFIQGKSYFKYGQKQYYLKGMELIKKYLDIAGKSGENYTEALIIYLELESRVNEEIKKNTLYTNGMKLVTLDNNLRKKYDYSDEKKGIVVSEVEDKSEAKSFDILPGSVILEINNVTVNSLEEFKKIYDKISADNSFLLYIEKNDYARYRLFKK